MDEDEELLGPPPREWPRLQRWRRPLAVLAGLAVVIGAAVTVYRSNGDGHSRPQARPATTPVAVGTSPAPAAPQPITVPEAQLPLCPIGRICETSYTLPDAVYSSLRAHLPDLQVAASRTLVARRSPDRTVLVARVIALRTAHLSGSIEIRRPQAGDADDASVDDDRTRVAGQASARVAGYTITVRVVGRSGSTVHLGELQELVGDQRLLIRPAANRAQSDDQGQR